MPWQNRPSAPLDPNTIAVERWDRARQSAPGETRIILTHTNDEVRDLNEVARGRMRDAGELGQDVHVRVERGDRQFATGDRVMFLRNERSMGVKNGTLGRIEQVSENHMTVRTDDGRSVAFGTKDYRDLDHGYAATVHKAQGMTVDRTHVLATPGMDRHGAYVALSRHRDGVDLHYGRDDFTDQGKLTRSLSRDRAKDMASDYAKSDPARDFAERRGIAFRARMAEVVKKIVPEKVRSIFDNFRPSVPVEQGRDIFAGFQPPAPSNEPARSSTNQRQPLPDTPSLRVSGVRGAVERYAKALDAIQQGPAQGTDAMPHQREALERAREALDTVRPDGSADLGAAFQRSPQLVHEAANGRSQAAMRAMQLETEIRMDPFQRADRFVEGLQQLRQQHEDLVRDGDFRGAQRASQSMQRMVKSLERDPQLESVLVGRDRRELGLEVGTQMGRSLSGQITDSIPFDHGHQISRSMGISR